VSFVSLAKRAWRRWTVIAHIIGNFQARVLLSLFYFVIVPPFALLVKLTKDPLQLRLCEGKSAWTERPEPSSSEAAARRQF
jgi:uncharacterized membrane protein